MIFLSILSECYDGESTDVFNFSHHETVSTDFLTSELREYINYPIGISDGFDLLDWWANKRNIFPRLHRIFVKYSNIPATSSVCEREFSYTGMVITDRRSRLLPKNVNDLMVARNNFKC